MISNSVCRIRFVVYQQDLQSVVSTNCTYLSLQDQNKLLKLLTEFMEKFLKEH